jgi:hypothetical protein
MGRIPSEPHDWLPELILALKSIADALAGQEPTPERLAALGSKFADAVPEHQVELYWLETGYLLDPEMDDPAEPEYAVTIYGSRLNAGWLIPAADLPGLLRLSMSN